MTPPDAEQREWLVASEIQGPSFAAVTPPGPRLLMFVAVPLSAALCRAARMLGWPAWVVDPRERFADPTRFPDAEAVLCLWPAEAYERLGGLDERTAVVALTHAPQLDDPALMLALRSPAFYVAALGSRRTQARRRDRLSAAGLGGSELSRLAGPAGLDLGGDTVEEAALAILAEAVAARHGRAGGTLSDSEHAIHAAPRPGAA